jgi:CubicO group peptidase (beta-lactamase class C family)
LTSVLSHIEQWVGPQGAPGVGAAVWHQGEIVAEHYAGVADATSPVTADTVFPLASVTKPITASTVLSLVDDGSVSLDEPVGRLVPAFRAGPAPGTEGVDTSLERLRPTVTARQLLSHTSGLPEDLGPRDTRYEEMVDLDTIIDQLSRLPLIFAPGTELRYSNAGFAVLTQLAERVSDQSLWHLARERVFAPLGIEDIFADPPNDVLPRVATLADTRHEGTKLETYNGAYWRGLALPWGGLYGTPRDVVHFAAAFLPSGRAVLSRAMTELAISDQTMGVPGGVESAQVRWDPGRWGLGWEVKGEKRRHWTGELTSPQTFCHFGHAGTLLWGDPERDLALAVFANRAVTHMWSFIMTRWARLSNAVVAAVD